jgi:hypothetical protein
VDAGVSRARSPEGKDRSMSALGRTEPDGEWPRWGRELPKQTLPSAWIHNVSFPGSASQKPRCRQPVVGPIAGVCDIDRSVNTVGGDNLSVMIAYPPTDHQHRDRPAVPAAPYQSRSPGRSPMHATQLQQYVSAVRRQALADVEGSGFGGEEECGGGDFVDLAEAADR